MFVIFRFKVLMLIDNTRELDNQYCYATLHLELDTRTNFPQQIGLEN